MELPVEFTQFLAFIGTPIFGAWVISEVLQHQKWFTSLSGDRKSLVTLFTYIGLGLLSYALTRWSSPEVATQLQPIYSVIVGATAAFISGTRYHETKHVTDVAAG